MYFIIVFVISFAMSASATTETNNLQECYSDNVTHFYFPGDGDQVVHFVDMTAAGDLFAYRTSEGVDGNNSYWLFTRTNPNTYQVLVIGDERSIFESNFDPSKATVFLVHGWKGHGGNPMNLLLTKAFLENGDVNVIVVDYETAADQNYIISVIAVPYVGQQLGRFIKWLTTLGLSYENVHLIGFSLGAHVVGNAGKKTQGRVKRITALDPAGPLWYENVNCLAKTDGRYVEIIHTNTYLYGYNGLLGDADFFPNGGSYMPGCTSNSCSHSLAWEYMAASVRSNNIISYKCNNVNEFINDTCHGDICLLGNSDLDKKGDGVYKTVIDDDNFVSFKTVPYIQKYEDNSYCV